MLPIPKASRWNGLVYLHGLLPLQPEESALNRLVITSGDFGLAYLTERWAPRFVSDMFHNYHSVSSGCRPDSITIVDQSDTSVCSAPVRYSTHTVLCLPKETSHWSTGAAAST